MNNNKYKVLIVEDEANICSFIETLLTTNDYQALVAHTCTMGLTLFASHNPDLVILDLGLPDRDGLELIRTVRQKYMTPIIVLSARTDEMDKIEALDLGANDYITKPFGTGELLARVRVALRLNRYSRTGDAASGGEFQAQGLRINYDRHKVISLPAHEGKVSAADVRDWCATFYADANHDHMAFPGMVYISHPSEYGTLYTKQELEDLHTVCQEYQMPLFLDGARLGYGLMAEGTDVTLADIARLTDVFYIGGTKVGALCGEAVVFPHGAPAHFMTMVKQQGALLAKGRLLGIQFDVLFTDDLYTKISKNAIDTANALKKGLAAKGYRFFMDSPTNQVFVILDNAQLAALEGRAKFGFWEKFDDTHTVVRIATSWATRMEEIEQLIALM